MKTLNCAGATNRKIVPKIMVLLAALLPIIASAQNHKFPEFEAAEQIPLRMVMIGGEAQACALRTTGWGMTLFTVIQNDLDILVGKHATSTNKKITDLARINDLETGAYAAGLAIAAWECPQVKTENLAALDGLVAKAPK